MLFFETHVHNEFSLFDGLGKSKQQVQYVKELGQKALGSTNHGNITGLIKHYKECVAENIVPILGCEFYFQPVFDKDKPRYHLCIFAKNMKGWHNLNRLTSIGNRDHFYRYPIITFEDLEEYSEGLICTSACIGSIMSQLILQGKSERALKVTKKFKKIFKNDFYIEIMPYEIFDNNSGDEIQIPVNNILFEIADELEIECIVTSDSHFIRKEDFDSYLKMHEMKSSNLGEHYHDRYIHTEEEVVKRIKKYHRDQLGNLDQGMKSFFKKVKDTPEWFKFEDVDMPKYRDDEEETYNEMIKQCRQKLKKEGKVSKEYKERLAFEADVIRHHGFQDYFMIVQEYVNWAKNNGCPVGPGRGSAGNSIINYALDITDLDAVYFKNNFDRFMRKDKKKFPDIDVDFCTNNRNRVIAHVLEIYPGKAAQTLTYGCYNIANLTNDLVKICGIDDKDEIKSMKSLLFKYCDDKEHTINMNIFKDPDTKYFNKRYDNIIKHFTKLYGKVRFFGTHASSVILCEDIDSKAGLMRSGDNLRTSFDLHDIEYLKLLKLDMLGLNTVTKVAALRKATGTKFSYDILNDKEVIKGFKREGLFNVFQFESKSACDIAREIDVESFEDIVVGTCLNRPGPLSLGLHHKYAAAKEEENTGPWYKYTKSTHGVLIYQEQGMDICKYLGDMDSENTDKLVKADLAHIDKEQQEKWRKMFFAGAKKNKLDKKQAEEVFWSLLQYSFNRGHGVAYAMLSAELMYYKMHFPLTFWHMTLKHEEMEDKLINQKINAVKDGCVLLLPHVNGSSEFSVTKIEGEKCLREGMKNIKGVGEKAPEIIVNERKENGKYKSEEDFLERMKPHKRIVNKRVLDALEENGALEFNEKVFYSRCSKYNATLASRRS